MSDNSIKDTRPYLFSAILFAGWFAVFSLAGLALGSREYNFLAGSIVNEGGRVCGAVPLVFLVPFAAGTVLGVVAGTVSVVVYVFLRARKKRRLPVMEEEGGPEKL